MRTHQVTTTRDVVYTTVDRMPLALDLHVPADAEPLASVVYFHGGGWRNGDRTDHEAARAMQLAARGFLVATVSYRLSGTALFPAQLDDARAAVEWVRAHATERGMRAQAVGAWGASAGGHLAALLALGNDQRPAAVEAAVCWFAPLDVSSVSGGSPLERRIFATSSGDALLGGPVDPELDAHRAANPISLVSRRAAPMMLMTGDRDRVVSGSVSMRMHDALVHAGARSSLHVVGGAGHEDPEFDDPVVIDTVAAFLTRWLTSSQPRPHNTADD